MSMGPNELDIHMCCLLIVESLLVPGEVAGSIELFAPGLLDGTTESKVTCQNSVNTSTHNYGSSDIISIAKKL